MNPIYPQIRVEARLNGDALWAISAIRRAQGIRTKRLDTTLGETMTLNPKLKEVQGYTSGTYRSSESIRIYPAGCSQRK